MSTAVLNEIGHTEIGGWKFLLRALRYRNYRLFFFGQGISLIGTWMQFLAISWLVYRLTGSPFILGVVAFASQVPTFLIAPFAGVLADRFARRRILLITQSLSALQAFLLTALTLSGIIEVWQIIMLSTILGIINGFDVPVRQAFVADMIERKEDFGNAIALNSSLFNLARFIGPSLAGLLIAATGEGICFFFNGLSFLAVIFALAAMRIKSPKVSRQAGAVLKELRDGLAYAFGFLPIRFVLFLVSLVSLLGMMYIVLMPIFAREILGGGAHTLGFLVGFTGLGALTGAVFLAWQRDGRGLERIVFFSTLIFSFGLMAFAFSRILWISLFVIFAVGFGMMAQMASANTILQNLTDDDKRGRVMSFFTMAFMGMSPFSGLLGGVVASHLGASATMFLSGLCCLLGVLLFSRRLRLYRTET